MIDLVPTILELAGGRRVEAWNGRPVPPPPERSLVPLLTKDGSVTHDYFWWEHEGNRALRVGDWKIVAAGKEGPWELYDLKTDRGESHNPAEEQAGKLEELTRIWKDRYEKFSKLARQDAMPEPAGKKRGAAAAGRATAGTHPQSR